MKIRVSVFGVAYSEKEWKFLNSAMLAVESLIEDDAEEPVAEWDSSLSSKLLSEISCFYCC